MASAKIDALLIALGRASMRARSKRAVLVAAPGSGNIGDQAMLEAFIANTGGEITVALATESALRLDRSSRVDAIVLSKSTELGFGHLRSMFTLGRLLRNAASFTLTGADIMDGGYSERASLARWTMVNAAVRAGVPTTVLGFSWNGRAPKTVLGFARKAGASGARLCSRDPVSFRRMVDQQIPGVIHSADSVFMLDSISDRFPEAEAIRNLAAKDQPLAIVNLSALVGRSLDIVAEMQDTVLHLFRLNYSVVLLPHVNRGDRGDIYFARELAKRLASDNLVLVDRLLSPSNVRWITSLADVVITGRMHLSIMALSQGVPSMVIATQGKVEGLAEMFKMPDLLVPAEAGLGQVIASRLDRDNLSTLRNAIAVELPFVIQRASSNFSHGESLKPTTQLKAVPTDR